MGENIWIYCRDLTSSPWSFMVTNLFFDTFLGRWGLESGQLVRKSVFAFAGLDELQTVTLLLNGFIVVRAAEPSYTTASQKALMWRSMRPEDLFRPTSSLKVAGQWSRTAGFNFTGQNSTGLIVDPQIRLTSDVKWKCIHLKFFCCMFKREEFNANICGD